MAIPDWIFEEKFGATTIEAIFDYAAIWQEGKVYRREDIVRNLIDLYEERGGIEKELVRTKVEAAIKKKLPGQQDRNKWFERIARGRYKYVGENGVAATKLVEKPADDASNNNKNPLIPDVECGSGPYEVYAWSLPHYRKAGDKWPIKIGMSGEGGFNRRRKDFHENLPELPNYLIRIGFKTETEARNMEQILHNIFRNRNCQIEDIPGKEWFITNREEILRAVYFIDPSLERS